MTECNQDNLAKACCAHLLLSMGFPSTSRLLEPGLQQKLSIDATYNYTYERFYLEPAG